VLENRDPLGYLALPVPTGFAEYGNVAAGWRYSYADRQHEALSLSALNDDLSGLSALPVNGLWKLSCAHRAITDDAFDHVVRFDLLEELDLGHTRITDRAITAMHTLQRLHWLSLSGCAVTDAAVEHLASLRSLEHLDISGTGVTDDGLRALAFHPALRVLNIRGSHVTGAGLAPLLTLEHLRQVSMSHKQHHHAHAFMRERPEVEVLF
jgi:hypothetical protein